VLTKGHRPAGDSRDERGMAMIIAVVCLLVVLTLTTVAVEQSVGGLSAFAQGRKLLQTVDAAEAGIQDEINAVQQWLSSPTLTVPCAGGSSVPGLPSGQGWVPAGASSSDSVVNAASLGYYSLSVATSTTEPTGAAVALPSSDACYGRTVLAPVATSSWYLLVQSQGVSSATTGGTTATGRTLQALLLVNEPSVAAYHRQGDPARTSGKVELVGFYTQTTSTYTSTATAQAVNFSPVSTTASTASYSGAGSPDPNVESSAQPSASPFTSESWLTLGALGQYAEADSSGASLACSGLVASPGTIPVGSSNPSCTPSGSPGPTGVTLDLSTVPAVGTVLSSIADVTLETSAITSSASMGTDGSPVSGSASFGALYVRVAVPGGKTVTIPVTVSGAPNENLLTDVTNAINSDASEIGPVTSTLISTLESTYTLTSNYQNLDTSNPGGSIFTESAIYLTIPSAAVTAYLAESIVGPNTFTAGSTTTTTTTTTTTVPPTTTTVPPTTTTVPPTTTTVPANDLTVIWIKQVP
jgi:hypothetical protein